MTIYCGNNRHELVLGKRLGTPYQCMKQGVGVGLHSSLKGYNHMYAPIIPITTYCGNGTPPVGKTLGTPTECLRKGVGIGKRLQYERGGRWIENKWWIYILILGVAVLTAVLLRRWGIILVGITISIIYSNF